MNRPLLTLAALACVTTTAAIAADDVRLSSVAAADGFHYAWLPTEAGVVLTRPGLRIVLRAGQRFYEVDNATPIADRAPVYDGRDLRISPALAAAIDELGAASSTSPARRSAAATPAQPPAVVASAPHPLTISVHVVPKRPAVAVSGTGTPNGSVLITLTGVFSQELPAVTIRRSTVPIDANGTFALLMGYGLDSHPGTIITATATTPSGENRAAAQVTIDATPSAVPSTALDAWPKN